MNSTRYPKSPTAIVTSDTLTRQRHQVARIAAIMLLVLSYLGTVFAFGGGATALFSEKQGFTPWLLAGVAQLALTWTQWAYGSYDRRNWIYIVSTVIDGSFTMVGYAEMVVPRISQFFVERTPLPYDQSAILAGLILAVMSFSLAIAPERTLVD